MRLFYIGLALFIAAIIIPLAIIAAAALSSPTTSGVEWGGVVVVFPIPIAIVMGSKPSLLYTLSWVALAIFVIMLILFLVMLIYSMRHRRSAGDLNYT